MTYRLFIDDERNPVDDYWVIVRSVDEAKYQILNNGCPYFIQFDHDLGEGGDAMQFLNWLIESDLDGTINLDMNMEFDVHSQNPVGKRNIQEKLSHYLSFKWSMEQCL